MMWAWLWLWLVVVAVVIRGAMGANVSYDGRALIINGQRRILFSGSIHYPRSTPDMWPSLITKAKQGGIDVIQTYVFWNLHEPQPGQYDFSGRNDIVRFIKEIQAQGLYASLRIGPFIEAEWTYGGLPFWLHDVPDIIYRSDNEPFKILMQNFTTKIVNLMKSEGLYASQGGPIIISQIENEYQNVEAAFNEKGPPYVRWAAAMAVGLETGVPWVMCKQADAPDPVINTCNGMRCGETFAGPNSPNKPSLWTENWTAYYQVYGQNTILRSAEDIAYHTALFIANKNGSFVNYYMYHGGTNFGRTASSYVPTSYYDQAPLDEYGLIRQPKWGHLKELNAAVKLCSEALLYGGGPAILSLGQQQNAYIYNGTSGQCAAFLVNSGKDQVQVQFQNISYELPSKSISILPDCKTVAFNTAKVSSQFNTRSMQPSITFGSPASWQVFKEEIPQFDDTSLRSSTLLEQTNTTKDSTDYLWYTFRYQHDSPAAQATLSVDSASHVLHAYVNGELVGLTKTIKQRNLNAKATNYSTDEGSAHGQKNTNFSLAETVTLNNGGNNISLLSIMTGLRDSGAYLEHKTDGLFMVTIQEPQKPSFTSSSWGYQVGLTGEKLQIYTAQGSTSVQWSPYSSPQSLTWYKNVFDAPRGSDPVALNLGSMGKGEAWINGQSIGRYWVSFHTPAGTPTQTWYNIPRSFLKHTGNLLVLLEEEYSNPQGISVDTVSITNVCGLVSDSHPPPVISWKKGCIKTVNEQNDKNPHGRRPKVQLHCPQKKTISQILFASYGTPMGDCGQYSVGSCHSSNSRDIVEKACLGKKKCTIPQSSQTFGVDPCPGTPKSLLVVAQCK